MSLRRIALIYDHGTRPETTGVYCLRALTELLEVEHFHPEQLNQVPSTGFDLYLYIDDGLAYQIPDHLRPNAWWAIDTHLAFERSLAKSQGVNWVFAAQKDGAAALRSAGISTASWLPLACDPSVHGQAPVPKRFDVCFVGNLVGRVRTELVDLLRRHFRNMYVGQDYFEEMARRYSESRVVFNRSVRNDVNMRVFEALASGSLLMTNDLRDNGLRDLFQDGVHLATYSGPEELVDKVDFYLRREEKREAISAAGRQAVLSEHTYLHRMTQLLAEIEARDGARQVVVPTETTPRRADPSYFEHSRFDVLELVPTDARHVLELGCGSGRLGEAIKQRQPARVVGVEIDPAAADQARRRLDEVVLADLEADSLGFDPGQFDAVVCADVLEHLRRPDEMLRRVRNWLKPSGMLVISVPNVRHHSVVRSLLNGNWTYERAGLLDSTHLRFFTRREIEKLLYRAGFKMNRLLCKPGPADPRERSGHQAVSLGQWHASSLEPNDLADLYAYQFLCVGELDAEQWRESGRATPAAAIASLRAEFPWPDARPAVRLPSDYSVALDEPVRAMLGEIAFENTIILELGARPGMSARLAEAAPKATIVTIDLWRETVEEERTGRQSTVPENYEACLISSWDHRERIFPLRVEPLEGLRLLQSKGVAPDLVYVDAGRAGAMLSQQLRRCAELFPNALLLVMTDTDRARDAVQGVSLDGTHALETSDAGHGLWKLRPRASAELKTVAHLTSIVIVTHNHIDVTRLCLESIRQFTDEPYELIIVDNGSTDGTADVLRSMPDVRVIQNTDNRGFPAGANQGIHAANGRQILLLNNDCIVTTGWLRRMLEALVSDSSIGLVGPCSNEVSGPQRVAAGYEQLADLDGFAWEWGRHNHGKRLETERLVGFCLLIRRAVIERIGLLDERFGVGNFEDDDYCRRAREAGFKAVIAIDSFVHHFGGQTFRGSDIDFESLMRRNEQLFRAKWSATESPSTTAEGTEATESPSTPAAFEIVPGGGLVLTTARPLLSLCMIVRDSSRTLEPCLASIRPWVDEMIVVDTGSHDDTPQIAERFGARVFHFPWCDSFALARNESLAHARGEWLFWMDSDDTIDENNGRALRDLVAGPIPSDVMGFVMQVHCPSTRGDGILDATVVDHVKLLRNLPEIRFDGRIHEQILPAIRRLGGKVEWSDIFVVHSGSDRSREGQAKKLARDLRLLELERAERPDHPFTLFNLGMTYNELGRHEQAIHSLRRSLENASPNESHVRKAYALLVHACAELEQFETARTVCHEGLGLFPLDTELLFRAGLLAQHFGRLREAERFYERVLNGGEPRHYSSVDRGIRAYKARQNLALVCAELGEKARAEEHWQRITVDNPNYADGWRGYVECLVVLGKLDDAQMVADRLSNTAGLESLGLSLSADVHRAAGDYAGALRLLDLAATTAPASDLELLRSRCRLLFESNHLREAEASLRELSRREPQDAAALHNLGAVCVQLGQNAEAARALAQSLRLRPDSRATQALYDLASRSS